MKTSTEQQAKRGKKGKIFALVLVVVFVGGGWWVWKEGRPWYQGVQAYIYGFPLVVMDLTRQASTAVPAPGEFTAPENQFSVMTHYPDASFRFIPRTGLDTQFALAWADLNDEPLVLSVPDTSGRYYAIALFDMWSNVFASIGSRTTGTEAGNFLLAGPGWQGTPPPDVKKVYRSPTRYVWVNGQMQSDGPKDYEVVNALQKQYKLTPLSAWGMDYTPPADVPVDPGIDARPALEQIRPMDAKTFFERFARLMKDNPPLPFDGPMKETLNKLGIEPGKDLNFDQLDAGTQRALSRGMMGYTLLEKGMQKAETKNGWMVIPHNFANYGDDYLTRAGIALIGLGGIWPRDILYPIAFQDANDQPLNGANRYVLHFDKGQTPPAKATWSVSMYDPEGFYVPNELDRYHLAAWMPLKYNEDGSLDIYIQAESPGADKEANWLPTPASGTFNLVTRIFWPEQSVLDRTWTMPGVKKMN